MIKSYIYTSLGLVLILSLGVFALAQQAEFSSPDNGTLSNPDNLTNYDSENYSDSGNPTPRPQDSDGNLGTNETPSDFNFTDDNGDNNYTIDFDNNSSVKSCSEDNSSCPENPGDFISSGPGDGSSGGKGDTEESSTSGGSGSDSCLTSWVCTEWSSCEEGLQTRTCSKEISYCYAPSSERPSEIQSCFSTEDLSASTEDSGALARITGAVIGLNEKTNGFAGIIIFFVVIAGAYGITVAVRRYSSK